MRHSHYRPDIDGLRGIAVLLVLCYHAELGFPGGFLGVDVFFVISGYLITGLTLRELSEQRFSLSQFWLRRIRRILPACLVMLAATLLLGAFLFLPADLVELCESATAHLLMVANAFFWRKTGYFDGSVALKPLLHMWSLAVEEQFYLLFPLCLKWLPPVDRKGKVAFISVFAASFLVGLYGHIRHPSAAFYLLPCRAWELLLGGVICLIPVRPDAGKPRYSFAETIALFIILLCACVPQPLWTRWVPPGLIPCLCTAGLLLTTDCADGVASKLLRMRPLVGVGKISYSLYLWHWPLLAFLKHLESDLQLEVAGPQYRMMALMFSFALAGGSHFLIEQPIRRKVVCATSRGLVHMVGGVATACLVVSSALIGARGLPARFDAEVLNYASAATQNAGRFVRTMSASDLLVQDLYACGPMDAETTCLVWGDSHAMCLLTGLQAFADRHAVRLDQATRYATAPLLNFDHLAIWRNDGASEFCKETLQLIETRRYDCVLLVAAWEGYLNWPSFEPALQATLDCLHQYEVPVVFVLPIPDQGVDVPMVLAGCVRRGRSIDGIGVTASDRQMRIQPLLQFLKQRTGDRLTVVDPTTALTDNAGVIRAALDGESLYSDHQHLSWAGSRRVAPIIMDQLLPLIRKSGSHR